MAQEHVKSYAGDVANIVKDKVTETSVMAKGAVVSGAWIYPLHGIYYFLSRPALQKSVWPVLYKLLIMAVSVTGGMFVFTYFPQAAFCALFSGPLGFIAAIPLVLSESYVLVNFIAKFMYLGKIHDELFDAVLLQQGNDSLVAKGRSFSTPTKGGGITKLGKSLTAPIGNKFSREGLARYIISLPLNAVPVAGTILFLLWNGVKAGPGYHARYYQLKGTSSGEKQAAVENQRGAYTAFGAVALALNLVPVGGLLFGFTSTVGAALWASDLEKHNKGHQIAGEAMGKETDTGRQIELS